jgi:predicted Zn-dependent protease
VQASYLEDQLDEVDKNVQYNTSHKHSKTYRNDKEYRVDVAKGIKDPKLLSFTTYTKIDEKLYAEKLAKDEQKYEQMVIPALRKNMKSVNVEPDAVDFYNVYRIAERLIRANNLDYVNWRIAIRKTEVSNAAAFDGSYIVINTGLYDSVYSSDEALAFVIAHEMAHHILGHIQRTHELSQRIEYLDSLVKSAKKNNQSTASLTELSVESQKLGIYKEIRTMEYMADAEALALLTRAGYSPYKGVETLEFLETFSNYANLLSTHPSATKRIESYHENIEVLDPNWKYVGIENIYNSDVLPCKKSSDRVSIVISKSKVKKQFYKVENLEQKLARIAYIKYLRGDVEDSIKFFFKLAKIDKDNYVPYVYLSYANEFLYNKTLKKRYLKRAKKMIIKSAEIKPDSDVVITQLENLGVVNQKQSKKSL